MLWTGCNVEKHYSTLSFFFDGVPDPNAPITDGSPTIDGRRIVVVHKPFQEEQCLQCHPDPANMQLTMDDGGICLKCHEEVQDQYPVMHAAVTSLACIWCHNPHMSAFPSLLRDDAPALCTQCHDEQNSSTMPPPHPDLSSDCLSCHSGHGGSEGHFLIGGEENAQDEADPPAPEQPGADE